MNNPNNTSLPPEFSEVTAVFEKYPEAIRQQLLALREIILETAASTAGVGQIVETLKWGQPSYLAVSGTTIRIDVHNLQRRQIGLYVHCRTSLIDTFRQRYPTLTYEGNRAIILQGELPIEPLREFIVEALTYHRHRTKPTL